MKKMDRFPLRNIFAALFCVVVSYRATIRGESGVGAGNLDGESATIAALAGETSQPVPNTPSLASAVRLDKSKVKIVVAPWDGGAPTDLLHVLRAKNDGPWEDISPGGAGGGSFAAVEFEDAAPAGHDYRYVAIVIGFREGIGMNLVASNPSNELRVADVAVKMEIGAQIATLPIDGFITFDGFLPESFASEEGATAPDPYESDGPYGDVLPYTSSAIGKRIPGFLQRGKSAFFTATITDGGDNGAATFWSSLTVSEWWVFSDEYVPPLPWFATAAEVAVPDLVFDGNPSLGFDGRSNPKWQMLPAGDDAEVSVHAAPLATLTPSQTWSPQIVLGDKPGIVTCAPMPITATKTTISHSGGSGDQLLKQHAIRPNPPNTSLNYPSKYFPFWSWGGGGDFGGLVDNIRGTLGVDIRPRIDVTVGVYAVYYRRRDLTDPPLEGTLITGETFLPDRAKLEAELNAVYNAANLTFHVTVIPQIVEFDAGEDTNGDGACTIDQFNRSELQSIILKANGDGYRISIFVLPFGRMGLPLIGPVLGLSRSFGIPSNIVFTGGTASDNTLAHEVGHCLGLLHSFQDGGNPASTTKIPDIADDRVMGYGHNPGGRLLIKPERDIIFGNIGEPLTTP